jgi:hypothetical protein
MPAQGAESKGLGAKGLVIVIVTSVICCAATIIAYDRFFAQKIVAVDLVSFIVSQKEDYARGGITAEELVANIENLARQMGKKRGNEILVLEEVVAGDVEHRRVRVEEDDRGGWVDGSDPR